MGYVESQKEQFIRLGVTGDFKDPYITLKPEFEAEQVRVFGKMAEKGMIYRGHEAGLLVRRVRHRAGRG